MKHYTIAEIQGWSRIYRANFVNSLSGFKPVSLIATVSKTNQPNLAIFSNIVHLGADPALIGFINRPREAAPHTIRNIESTGFYTINHILPSFVDKAHQTSAKYDLGISEFEKVNLPVGSLDITMYRDDLRLRPPRALAHTEIPDGGIDHKIVILVDDVLDTGRTVRAALNELFDYGRPAKVDLAVLADRHRRQLPVDATFKGAKVKVADDQILVLEQLDDGRFRFSAEAQ
mgnify:CR=1 FL=1